MEKRLLGGAMFGKQYRLGKISQVRRYGKQEGARPKWKKGFWAVRYLGNSTA